MRRELLVRYMKLLIYEGYNRNIDITYMKLQTTQNKVFDINTVTYNTIPSHKRDATRKKKRS